MRVDSHQHFWARDGHSFLPDTLFAILRRNRFDGSIAVQAEGTPEETRWLLGLAEQNSFIEGVIGVLDFGLLDEFQRSPRFCGVCARGIVADGLEELERRNLTLDILIGGGELREVPRMAERAPGLRIVLDHMALAGPAVSFDEWAEGMAGIAALPKVFVKLSGLFMSGLPVRPYIQHLLKALGPERLLFGSDWPAALPAYSWKENLAYFTQSIGAQTIEVREQLLGETARRVYGISV